MKHEKICGSTSNIAELIVEYDNKGKPKRLDIKGVPTGILYNKIMAAWWEWSLAVTKWGGLVLGFGFIISLLIENMVGLFGLPSNKFSDVIDKLYSQEYLLFYALFMVVLSGIISLFHINEKFDQKWKKYFAVRTGDKVRNKATFIDFISKEFIIYDINNIVVEFEATKDVSKQLKKVWIREDPLSSMLESQANIKGLVWKGDEGDNPIWNAHFFFRKIPKSGKLYVEWI